MNGLADPLARAKAYPYPLLDCSYVIHADGHHPIADDAPLPDLGGRTPVLASGSNQSPDRLGTKFIDAAEETLPVVRSRIRDFDSVYSAHFSGYGSVPSTIQHTPGTTATLFVTWLTPRQLDRMHETEAVGTNYDYGRISSEAVRLSDGRTFSGAGCYIGRRGALALDGEPVALAEIAADGRTFTAEPQLQMLDRVHSAHGTGEAFEPWLAGHVESPDRRKALTDRLALTAEPFDHPAFAFDR